MHRRMFEEVSGTERNVQNHQYYRFFDQNRMNQLDFVEISVEVYWVELSQNFQ